MTFNLPLNGHAFAAAIDTVRPCSHWTILKTLLLLAHSIWKFCN